MAIDLNDKTSNGNNLTNVGATEVSTNLPFAQSLTAVDLESGSSQYLHAPDSASLSITGNMTIEAWGKFESFSSNTMTFVGKYHTGTSQQSYLFFYDGVANLLYLGISSNGSNANFASVAWTPTLGVWYHVAVVYTSAGGTADFYVDGSQQGTQQTGLNTSIFNGTEKLGIGALGVNGGVSGFFDGQLDEIRIWNTTRTGTQINDNKAIEIPKTSSGLVAYYPFDEISSISLSPSASASPSSSVSLSPSLSPSPSSSESRSPSASESRSPSLSPSPSSSPSLSGSPSASPSLSPSPSSSPSVSESRSPSISGSSSPSPSPSASPSPSSSESRSPSLSPSVSESRSPSISVSLSPSLSPSISPSESISLSPSTSESRSSSTSVSRSISLSPSSSISPSPSPAEYIDKYSDTGNPWMNKYREWGI